MYKSIFNKHNSLKFNRFSNKGYALFLSLIHISEPTRLL